jgi:integrase
MKKKLTKELISDLKPTEKPYEVRDTKQEGLLLRVQPSDVRTWYFDFKVNGIRNRYRLGRSPGLTAEGARALSKQLVGKVALGIDVQAEKRAAKNKAKKTRQSTLRAFLDGQYGEWATHHLRSGEFAVARIRSDFEDWLDKPMSDLNTWLIDGWRNKERKRGKSPVTINRDVQRLQSCLSRAVFWNLIDRHPFTGLRRLDADRDERVRYLTQEEERQLRRALEDRESALREARDRFNEWREARGYDLLPPRSETYVDHIRPMTLLAMNTGLRRGELLSLRWGAVDLRGRLLTVTAATAKSRKTRHIPLNDEALAVLQTWKKLVKHSSGDALVFPRSGGKRMTRIDTAWASLMKRAKITDFRFHDLRHHFASRLVQAGTDLNVVRELLGHSEIKMTLRYSHLAPSNLRAAVEKVAG